GHRLLEIDEERRLTQLAAAGDATARELVIQHNLRLVDRLARRRWRNGRDRDDLFQDAVLGLLRAVDRFDPSRGFRFSTYAYKAISTTLSRGSSLRPLIGGPRSAAASTVPAPLVFEAGAGDTVAPEVEPVTAAL